MAIVMLSLYMVVITLIFLNVLIAMFSEGVGFLFAIYILIQERLSIQNVKMISPPWNHRSAWVKIRNIAAIHQSIFYWDVISEMRLAEFLAIKIPMLRIHIRLSYNLPFNIFNPVVQLLLIIWTLISTPIAIIIYFIELVNSKDKRNFPTGAHFRKLLGYFIRLKLFPRIMLELKNNEIPVISEQKIILASL